MSLICRHLRWVNRLNRTTSATLARHRPYIFTRHTITLGSATLAREGLGPKPAVELPKCVNNQH
jgi:hypothetical protein